VFIGVALHNVGKTRIQAKTKRDSSGNAYSDKAEKLKHACTLQVKSVLVVGKTGASLDWFDSDSLKFVLGLEELNLLSEYEVPERSNAIEFWMEPGEAYNLGKPVVLGAGIYLAKVTFIGSRNDEDFWTRIVQFSVPTP
jgi:hypothetical protein